MFEKIRYSVYVVCIVSILSWFLQMILTSGQFAPHRSNDSSLKNIEQDSASEILKEAFQLPLKMKDQVSFLSTGIT